MAKGAKRATRLQKSLASLLHQQGAKTGKAGKSGGAKPTKNPPADKKPHEIPFHPTDRVLLVGEGNFSFAVALLDKITDGQIVATAYDPEDVCVAKYPDAKDHVAELRDRGATVIFEVDATKLDTQCAPLLRESGGAGFHKVVFNFPHVGLGITDQTRNIEANQRLIAHFIAAVPAVLTKSFSAKAPVQNARSLAAPFAETGRAVAMVTIKSGAPYDQWDVKRVARAAGARCLCSFEFVPSAYPAYAHRRTLGFAPGVSVDDNGELAGKRCTTYVFDGAAHSR